MKNKVVSIFAFPSHQTEQRTSGVDFVRILQPMKYLDGYTYNGTTFRVDFYDIHKDKKDQLAWEDIAKKYDIVFLNYTVLDWNYAAMGAFVHGLKKKIIMDIDDAIFYIRPDNATHDALMRDNGKLIYIVKCILDDVDRVTTTSSYLRNIICDKTYKRHPQVGVFPNYIDLDTLYTYRGLERSEQVITITHFGSTTHFEDLQQQAFFDGMNRIMREYPNVRFITVGAFIPKFRMQWGERYENQFGAEDIYAWIKNKFPYFMGQTDIVVSPLEVDIYNKAKSAIKFLEYSSAKKPGIYQNIRQYQEVISHGRNGFLAETADEWYISLKRLINNRILRTTIGDRAFRTAQDYQMKNHVREYAEFFATTLDNP